MTHARAGLSREEHAGGVVAVTLAMVLMGGGLRAATAISSGLTSSETPTLESHPEPEPRPVEVVQARFVRLGTPLPPRRLPDRYVASARTAPILTPPGTPAEAPAAEVPPSPTPELRASPPPEQSSSISTPTSLTSTMEPAPTRTAQPVSVVAPAPADSREDPLTRLGDRASATAVLARPREREGDAEGIAEGIATREEGDIYLGRLYTFFRRGWHVPTSVADDDLRTLSCVVEVALTLDARVGTFRITRPSGNDDFDQSVRLRMNQAEGSSLPPPPADEADRFLGRAITLRFLGRHAR